MTKSFKAAVYVLDICESKEDVERAILQRANLKLIARFKAKDFAEVFYRDGGKPVRVKITADEAEVLMWEDD
ncbi:MAG: hypothetical protein AAFR65_14040 [Pseudomonadota bacterium]